MFLLSLLSIACARPAAIAENVVIVIADGLREEEVYGGGDESLVVPEQREGALTYCQGTPEERRKKLMPFLWSAFVNKGQLFGDRNVNSVSQVTNQRYCSYPGYSEMLCGYADPGISCNKPLPNPNVTVFEWLNQQPRFAGRVAAFGAWSTISAVFNKERCNFTDDAGYEPVTGCKLTPELKKLNADKASGPRAWAEEASDEMAFHTTLEYVKANRPKVLFLSLGETDKWGHEQRYDRYLNAAHHFDAYVATLWKTMQSMPQYRNKTTFILSCDHGRGAGRFWGTHGAKYDNSKYTWMAYMGPGTRPLGEMRDTHVTNSQIAATAAGVLGFNYPLSQFKAASPIDSVLH